MEWQCSVDNAIQEEKAFSEEASSLVNSAYSTLKSPLDRAIYLVRSAARTRACSRAAWCLVAVILGQSLLQASLCAAGEERHWYQ